MLKAEKKHTLSINSFTLAQHTFIRLMMAMNLKDKVYVRSVMKIPKLVLGGTERRNPPKIRKNSYCVIPT